MRIHFEKEFSTWLSKQTLDYINNTSTESLLVKFIAGNFLGTHYSEMANIIVAETEKKSNSGKS